MMASLEVYLKANQVERGYVKSDNAGTYHSDGFLIPLWSNFDRFKDFTLMGYKFSAPSCGKDRCDSFRCATYITKIICVFVCLQPLAPFLVKNIPNLLD